MLLSDARLLSTKREKVLSYEICTSIFHQPASRQSYGELLDVCLFLLPSQSINMITTTAITTDNPTLALIPTAPP